MMNKGSSRSKLTLAVAGTVFAMIALGHLTRMIAGVSIVIGSTEIPVWISGLSLAVATLLSAGCFGSACCSRSGSCSTSCKCGPECNCCK